MKLNISQEKLKRLKGKIALFTAATATVIGLAGCTNTDAITLPSDAPITSEMPSSEVPSSSEEMPSEEVSEELPSEEVNEEYYSAEEVMKHIDDLIAKYPYNNPEHIKSLAIAVNLDYITAEDLDVILNTYGYSMDDLATLYDECILDNSKSSYATYDYYKGNVAEIAPENKYDNRITLQATCLNEEDAQNAKWFDTFLIEGSSCKYMDEKEDELFAVILSPDTNVDELSSFEKTCYNYTSGVYVGNFEYANYIPNSYVSNQKVNGK